ncbi:hypothetical protein CMsap09_11910 [Clavibacter michiganensis]|uniref:Uncharacterized protein n=1 Tax=Clavibacter michiganensis TaxID=28447 RepID=A0A251XWM1_9MICO|nr:hypothetical protein CMsap09_11910 [Clavibacter michiganensis]
MSVPTPVAEDPAAPRARLLPAPLVLLVGLVLVPLALGLAANSWSTPDAAAYVRMAFASVAGIVVAIGTVVLLLVDRIRYRAPAGTMVALTVVVAVWGASSLDSTLDLLLQRLASLG